MNPDPKAAYAPAATTIKNPTSADDHLLRRDALDRAIGVAVSPGIEFNGRVDDYILALAAKFEAYVRDGAA